MPLTTEQVHAERQKGYAWTCCVCVKLHQARDAGHEDGCMALLTGKVCGSPLRGHDFPEYEGPLSVLDLLKFCFVCGDATTEAVRVKGASRHVGVCGKCKGMLQTHIKAEEGAIHG